MKKVRLIRPSNFVWVVVPLALFGFHHAVGAPHFIISYDWRPIGSKSYSDFSGRWYTRCTFYGPAGAITEFPTDGKCGWVRFAHADRAKP